MGSSGINMKYLACIDGSPHSKYAFDKLLDSIATKEDEIFLYAGVKYIDNVYVDHAYIDMSREREVQEQKAAAMVESYVEAAKNRGFENVHGIVKMGEVREDICDTAKEKSVDMIISGARGAGVLERLLLGSTTAHLLHHAPCSLFVIRQSNVN